MPTLTRVSEVLELHARGQNKREVMIHNEGILVVKSYYHHCSSYINTKRLSMYCSF